MQADYELAAIHKSQTKVADASAERSQLCDQPEASSTLLAAQ